MTSESSARDEKEYLAALAGLSEETEREQFLAQNAELHQPRLVAWLCEQIPVLSRVDLRHADNVARAAAWLAEELDDESCRAHSLRAAGHMLFLRGEHARALECYRSAEARFESLGAEVELGRTLSSSLQALIYLGRYEEAFASADKAREIFERLGDRARLARLDANLGNVLHRLDQFEEALTMYHRAYEELSRSAEPQAVATVLHNMAVCYISVNRFPEALEAYEKARECCEKHNLPLLRAQADYNIAYLHYLRGEYPRASELYQATRELCEKLNDAYHHALCDLDQAEMYLDLGRSEEGGELAEQSFASFETQGLGYESGKALAILALCRSRQGKPFHALELFEKARQRFSEQKNGAWMALVDLYRALILDQEGRLHEARNLCQSALSVFAGSSSTGKAVLCELLLARLHLRLGDLRTAKGHCTAVLDRLCQEPMPALSFQAYSLLGQVEEAVGNRRVAHDAYLHAHSQLENLRNRFPAEELKIGFFKDKLVLYESLVAMCMLPGGKLGADDEKAFSYIQQAKSRAMADLVGFRSRALPAPTGMRSGLVEQVRELREELNWYYRQIDLQEIREGNRSPERVQSLRRRTRECEDQLARVLGDVQRNDREFAALLNVGTVDLAVIRSVLPPDAVLLEYYQARGIVYAAVLDSDHLGVVPLSPVGRVREQLRLLRQQLFKCQKELDSPLGLGEQSLLATQYHLQNLYQELIAPVRDRLGARRLILAPHGFLYYIPFHALFNGRCYLIDEYPVWYAPSASVFYLSCQRQRKDCRGSVILAVSDQDVGDPFEEAEEVASLVDGPRLLPGKAATEQRLRTLSPTSRFLHVAAKAHFCRDNPMFSAIRLADSSLTLLDLYGLDLSAELVTLSGCGVGFGMTAEGEELMGLERGLLYAGAQAVLLPLWNVSRASTRDFMKIFYSCLRSTADKSSALRFAMRQLRETRAHPFDWAPYVVVGKVA
jgi:CHAT domain-containing protein/Flp pilus assembly protein TadD